MQLRSVYDANEKAVGDESFRAWATSRGLDLRGAHPSLVSFLRQVFAKERQDGLMASGKSITLRS